MARLQGVLLMSIHRNTRDPNHIVGILLQLLNEERIDKHQYNIMRSSLTEDDLQGLLDDGCISQTEYDIMQQAEDVRRDAAEKQRKKARVRA